MARRTKDGQFWAQFSMNKAAYDRLKAASLAESERRGAPISVWRLGVELMMKGLDGMNAPHIVHERAPVRSPDAPVGALVPMRPMEDRLLRQTVREERRQELNMVGGLPYGISPDDPRAARLVGVPLPPNVNMHENVVRALTEIASEGPLNDVNASALAESQAWLKAHKNIEVFCGLVSRAIITVREPHYLDDEQNALVRTTAEQLFANRVAADASHTAPPTREEIQHVLLALKGDQVEKLPEPGQPAQDTNASVAPAPKKRRRRRDAAPV